jgi:hypothetical protein
MGAITRAAANNITTGGVILPAGINDASVASVTELAQVSAGDGITLISSQTASSSASLSFTTGIDSTYRTYLFKFINMNPSSDSNTFHFQGSTDGGSSYGVTITSSLFRAYHDEGDTQTNLDYLTDSDLAQSTSYQPLVGRPGDLGSGSDESLSGYFYLFNPSSTTYVKHFMAATQFYHSADFSINNHIAGYFNTTSAINAINFKMASGNINAGTIHLYGIA